MPIFSPIFWGQKYFKNRNIGPWFAWNQSKDYVADYDDTEFDDDDDEEDDPDYQD
jgi:hypothetical protein